MCNLSFEDLKVVLSSFGLWPKVSAAYNTDGSIKDFALLDNLTRKLSRSERAIIQAITGLYHNRKTVTFTELYNALDKVNTDKMVNWWLDGFKPKGVD